MTGLQRLRVSIIGTVPRVVHMYAPILSGLAEENEANEIRDSLNRAGYTGVGSPRSKRMLLCLIKRSANS